MIEATIGNDTFPFHDCEYIPFRLEPANNAKGPICPKCDIPLVDSLRGDGTVKEMMCPECRQIIPESRFKLKGEITALGKLNSELEKTTFVSVSANKRTISAGPRSNPILPKNRTFDRNPHDTGLGYTREDLPLLAGKEDMELVEMLNHGIITNVTTSGEESEE